MVKLRRFRKAALLVLGLLVVTCTAVVLTVMLWNPGPVVTLKILEGLEPESTHEEKVSSNHWYKQGKKSYYDVDLPFDQALASVAIELRPEDGWRRSEVRSSLRITLFAQKLPGDEFYRCTVGVQERWWKEPKTRVTVSEPSRRIGGVERFFLRIREGLGL